MCIGCNSILAYKPSPEDEQRQSQLIRRNSTVTQRRLWGKNQHLTSPDRNTWIIFYINRNESSLTTRGYVANIKQRPRDQILTRDGPSLGESSSSRSFHQTHTQLRVCVRNTFEIPKPQSDCDFKAVCLGCRSCPCLCCLLACGFANAVRKLLPILFAPTSKARPRFNNPTRVYPASVTRIINVSLAPRGKLGIVPRYTFAQFQGRLLGTVPMSHWRAPLFGRAVYWNFTTPCKGEGWCTQNECHWIVAKTFLKKITVRNYVFSRESENRYKNTVLEILLFNCSLV